MINFFLFNLTQGSWPSRSCRWSRRSRTPRSRESGRRSDPSTTGTRHPPPPWRRDPGCSQRKISLRTHRPAQVITKTLLSLLSTLHSSPSPPQKKDQTKAKIYPIWPGPGSGGGHTSGTKKFSGGVGTRTLNFIHQSGAANLSSLDNRPELQNTMCQLVHASLAAGTWSKYASGWKAFQDFEAFVSKTFTWPLSKDTERFCY